MSVDSGNDISEWIDSFSQQQIQIWCEDPETNMEKLGMGMGKTYVTYRILMKQVGRDIIGVRHRYSEFETLRNSLRDRYGALGIAVPALPPKNSVSNMLSSNLQQTFIKERILGLTIFCELIVASPWLRNDKLWKEFMKPKVGGGSGSSDAPAAPSAASRFSAAFRGESHSPVPSVVYDGDNVGENKLIACLQQLEVPYKFTLTQRMEEVRIELASIDKFVKLALEKTRNMQASERAYASAQESAAEALGQWLLAEQAGVRTMAGRTFDENHNVVEQAHEQAAQSTSSLATLLKTKSGLFTHYPDYTGLTLAVLLEQELAMVESLKELLRLHDEMINGIESMTAKIVKTEASRSANKFEQAAEQRIILEERQTSLTAFYKGFIYFSLPCSARFRAASLRRFSSFLSASQLTSSYALQVACLQFFTEISVKPTTAIAEASRLFDLLKVKQLQVLPEEVALSMCSPSVSPSTTMMNLSDSAASLSINKPSSRGLVTLCEESTGVNGLFRRAQSIGQGKGQVAEPRRNVIGSGGVASSTPAPAAEPANPLAVRRGSAVIKNQQLHGHGTTESGSADGGSSLMAEVPDELLSEYNIRPSEDTPAPLPPTRSSPIPGATPTAAAPARSDPFSSRRLSPLKPSEKSQSLMADLMGGGSGDSSPTPASKQASVWEDV